MPLKVSEQSEFTQCSSGYKVIVDLINSFDGDWYPGLQVHGRTTVHSLVGVIKTSTKRNHMLHDQVGANKSSDFRQKI